MRVTAFNEDRPDWWDQAACLGVGPDVFFATGQGSKSTYKLAAAYCAICPVIAECDEAAKRERYGYWAGGKCDDRGEFKPRPGRPQSAAHGTRSRYVSGCRCDECRAAQRAYDRVVAERRRVS